MTRGKLLAVCIVWLMLAGTAAVTWRYFFKPNLDEQHERARELVIEETSGSSRYKYSVDLALDQFSGYAVLRSQNFQEELNRQAIRVRLIDDQADYAQRLRRLQSGETQIATFTVDALIKASAELQDLPAVIVAVIDESRGADAMVAAKSRYPNISALNTPETRFVFTGNSPSEMLTRVVKNSFSLDRVDANPFKLTASPEETMAAYRKSPPNSPDVFVIWEPYVSEILENDAMHVVVDSSRFRDYIVDVLVVNRDYLLKNGEVVRAVVGSYFAASHRHRDDLAALVAADAKQSGMQLSTPQVQKLVSGIRWKNLPENLAHFGIQGDGRLKHIEDMITNVTKVLLSTQGIDSDPTGNAPEKLFNQKVVSDLLQDASYAGLINEPLTVDKVELPVLTPAAWSRLREIGELQVPSLVFARGTDRLQPSAQATLDGLVETLQDWPQTYVLVRGNASRQGDLEANRKLAENRARAAAAYLIDHGIHESRISAIGADPSGEISVSFVLGEAAA